MKTEHQILKKHFPDYTQMGDHHIIAIVKAMNDWASFVNPNKRIKTMKLILTWILGLLFGLAIGFALLVYQYNQLTL